MSNTEDFEKTPSTPATVSDDHFLPYLNAISNTALTPVVITNMATDVNDSST